MINFDQETAFTHRVLDAIAVRTKVAMHNMANQNVPGFKRYRVKFEELLRTAADAGQPLHRVEPMVERDMSGAPGHNNVSLMEEMADLDKTRLLHDLFTRRAGGYFSHINRAIFGR